MTLKEYLRDPALVGEMTITALIPGEKPAIRAASTWFHPQGGGQRADKGTIGDAEVVSVRHAEGGEVDHFVTTLAGFQMGQAYAFAIEPETRVLNARYHSAGHLLAAVAERLYPGVKGVNGHHWPGEARVEFQGEGLEALAAGLPALEAAINAEAAKAVPVAVTGDPFVARAIQIEGHSAVPCGGTHTATTADLAVVLRSAKLKGDTLRVGYDLA
jgi:alanyl-tRNA synthetase